MVVVVAVDGIYGVATMALMALMVSLAGVPLLKEIPEILEATMEGVAVEEEEEGAEVVIAVFNNVPFS